MTEVKAREKALGSLYRPRLYLQGAAYARGTGIQPDGRTGGVASGLGPNIQNWALGATITFPAFDWFSIRARKEIEVHNERSAAATYDQTLQDLTGQVEKAKAVLEGARRVGMNAILIHREGEGPLWGLDAWDGPRVTSIPGVLDVIEPV